MVQKVAKRSMTRSRIKLEGDKIERTDEIIVKTEIKVEEET